MNELIDKVAVVTGSGRGIGRAISMLFAKAGAKVVVNDYGVCPAGISHSSQGPAQSVVDEIENDGGTAVADFNDVSDIDGGKKIIDNAIDEFGKIDIVVNNAGIVRDSMIYKMTEKNWDNVIKVHLYGTYHCTRHAVLAMKEQNWGRIINMASTAGLGRTVGAANYAAAKEGIVGFTRAVARDFMKYNVTCNAIRPLAKTRHFDERRKQEWLRMGRQAVVDEIENSVPEDVASFVLYLASDRSSYITGRTFQVAGKKISLYSEPSETRIAYSNGRWDYKEISEVVPRLFELEPYEINHPEAIK